MAKQKFTTKELLNMSVEQLNKLDMKTLRQITTQVGSVANKRIDRLQKANLDVLSSYNAIQRSGGKIRVKGKTTIQQVRREFARAVQFLNTKSSTLKGAKQILKETSERIGSEQTSKWSVDDWRTYWKAYDLIKEQEKTALAELGSDRLQEMLRDEFYNGNTTENILENARQIIDDYKEKEDDEIDLFTQWNYFT